MQIARNRKQGQHRSNAYKHFSSFPRPRSCLRFWSRETGSAVPSRVDSPILHAWAESGVHSQALLFLPISATVLHCIVCRCHWNERLGAWVQLEVHRQHHREHCYLIKSLQLHPADVYHPLVGPHLAFTSTGMVPPRL